MTLAVCFWKLHTFPFVAQNCLAYLTDPSLKNYTHCLNFGLLQTLISGHSRASNDPEKSSSFKPKSPAQAPKIEEVDLGQPQSRPQLQQRPTPPPPGPNGISNPMTNARPPQAAAERAAAENAAQTLAAALNSGQHNEATTDPRLNVSIGKAQSSLSLTLLDDLPLRENKWV